MDRAELTSTESHGVLVVGRKANDGFWGIRIERKGDTAAGANDPPCNMDGAVAISEWPKRPPLSKPQIFGTLFAHRGIRILWKLRRNRLGHADAGSLIRLILRDGLSLLI
jgi:hypothetical protein